GWGWQCVDLHPEGEKCFAGCSWGQRVAEKMVPEMRLEERLEAGGRQEEGASLGQRRPNSAEARDRSVGPLGAFNKLYYLQKTYEESREFPYTLHPAFPINILHCMVLLL
uniref:Uncharacterized protein n=1 Tax=Ailuropoda melanoleuca TaxID=9646 RepID=A0A7N5KRE6_AILME